MPRPIIVAHRGLHDTSPENSRGAFIAACDAELPWVECDVWPSADGVPIVLHDETLDRTTRGHGPIWNHLWEDLLRIPYREGWGHLPSLHQVAEDVAQYPGVGLLVEIKPPDARDLVREAIDSLKLRSRTWMLQSFHESNLIHALACDVNAAVAYLVHDYAALDHALSTGWDRIHLDHHFLDRATADRLHAAGVHIGVWTVNEPEDLRRVMALGIEMLITDQPLRAQYIADEKFGSPVPASGTPGEG